MQSVITLVGMMLGGAAAVYFAPGQWEVNIAMGVVAGIIIGAITTRFEERRPNLYSPAAKFEPQVTEKGIRLTALGLCLLATFTLALLGYAQVQRFASPAMGSIGYFMCAMLLGAALHMLIIAKNLVRPKPPAWPSSEEAAE